MAHQEWEIQRSARKTRNRGNEAKKSLKTKEVVLKTKLKSARFMRQESVLNVFRTALIMLVPKAPLTGAAAATAFAQTIPRRQLRYRTPKAQRGEGRSRHSGRDARSPIRAWVILWERNFWPAASVLMIKA